MVGTTPLKLSNISLGDDQTTWTRRNMVFEWSDDDEVSVAPPPSTEAPLHNMRVGVQSRRGEEVPEQQAMGVPTQQALGVPEQQARGVPEQQAEVNSERQAERVRSGRRRRGRRWRRWDLHPKAQESTPWPPHQGARVGNVGSRNCTSRPNQKYTCRGVSLLSFLSFFGD